jgi:hypothetical protein
VAGGEPAWEFKRFKLRADDPDAVSVAAASAKAWVEEDR